MSATVFSAFIFVAALTFTAAQSSCKGRCGAEYYRGFTCQCDYSCLTFDECCQDYESQCTTKLSCKGRCGETFKRGRLCSCDSDCGKYKQCCQDYRSHCDAVETAVEPFSGGSDADNQLMSAEPTMEMSTETVTITSQTKTTPTNDGSTTLSTAGREGPAESSEMPVTSAGLKTTFTQETTAGYYASSQSGPTSASQTGSTAFDMITEMESSGQTPEGDVFPEVQTFNPTEASTLNPDVTAQPSNTGSYSPEASVSIEITENYPETSQPITTSVASDPSPSSEETTSNPPLTTGLPSDLSTSIFPVGHNDMTTLSPSSTAAAKNEAAEDVTPQKTIADPEKANSEPQPSEVTSDPLDQSDLYTPPPTKPMLDEPSPKPVPVGAEQTTNTDELRDYQADDSNDTNLCSGRPVSAVTTLRNGTIVVFRGHYFWFLDSNRVSGPAQGITQVWGVPSPVDTVFTRCNCQGKTYIFKGPQYWRFENDVLDSGYPKVIQTGFDGLGGHITAALSIPQYQRRRESVYFFKRGGFVQKYSYQYGTSPTCSTTGKYAISIVPKRTARQAASVLEPAIKIAKSWRGFPYVITAAVSVPNNKEPEGYKYFVFSGSKSYNVRMDGERPVVAAPKANMLPKSSNFIQCPEKV